MNELDFRIIKFLSDYKSRLDNLRYDRQKSEEEIAHNFFWEDKNKSTKLINFYQTNGGFLIFDNDNINLAKNFNLTHISDKYSDKLVLIKSQPILFKLLNYLIESNIKP